MFTRFRPSQLLLVLALLTGGGATVHAAEAPAREFRLPPAPSAELQQALVDALARANKSQSTAERRYNDAYDRLRANWRVAPSDEPAFDLEAAAREALLATEFGDASKRQARKQLPARLQLLAMMIAVDMHSRLRVEFGRRQALRAVMACKGASACLDAIQATATMPAEQIASVRAEFGADAAALATAELASAQQLDALSVMYADGMHLLVLVNNSKADRNDPSRN